MMMAVGWPSNQPGGDPPKKRRSAFCRELSGRFLMEYRWAFCCTFHWELLWCHVEETNVDPFQVSAAIDLKVSSFSVSWYIFDMMALWNHGISVSWYHAGIMVPLSSPSLCLWLPRSGGRRVSWNGNQSLIFFLLSQRAKDFKAFSLRHSEAWWTFSVFFCVLETFNTLSFSAPIKTGTHFNGMYIWELMKMCLRLRRQL